jgi:hypothetical protein
MTYEDAAKEIYELVKKDKLEEAGLYLKAIVKEAT